MKAFHNPNAYTHTHTLTRTHTSICHPLSTSTRTPVAKRQLQLSHNRSLPLLLEVSHLDIRAELLLLQYVNGVSVGYKSGHKHTHTQNTFICGVSPILAVHKEQKSHASTIIALIHHSAHWGRPSLCIQRFLPKTYRSMSVWGALHRLDSSLTSSSAQRKQIGRKCTMFVISWHVAYFTPHPCHSLIWSIDAAGRHTVQRIATALLRGERASTCI